MKRKIELLAPGGDVDSIKAAITAGADAIYCGLDRFNARNRAKNISLNDLNGILRLAHKNDCEVFLTLNIIIVESEIPTLINLLNKVANTTIDGLIIQDLGMFYLLGKYYPDLTIHASTQLTTHNEGQIKFLNTLNATRVNLSRELNLHEIEELTATAHENNMLTEVFVHGSYCISFSGICYFSSVHGGNSGNRGRCSQPCRDQYLTTAAGKNFPLNLKDNSAYFDLRELGNTGVDSIKIEGRIKKFHYVYTVVSSWRKQLQSLYEQDLLNSDNSDLHTVFNREFSNSFLKGDINKSMFIDNPRDNSAIHLAKLHGGATDENIDKAKRELYDKKTEIIHHVRKKIEKLSIEKAPLIITISGKSDAPLKVSVKTPDAVFTVFSSIRLTQINNKNNAGCLGYEMLSTRLKALNETEYFIKTLEVTIPENDLFMPFKELTSIKNRILFILNDSKEPFSPIDIPRLQRHHRNKTSPALSIIISSRKDLYLCDETSAAIYFQIPNSLQDKCSGFLDLFLQNKQLTPWFPSILIGDNYKAAVELLEQLPPKQITTNNSGIAYECYQRSIPWIAGPYLNIVNSFSLLCLKEKFNCLGAFISNELKRTQIKAIKKPSDFKLYYKIYHPIVLLTSRQCLFQQVTGCKKNTVDEICIQQCEKSTNITNLKNASLIIDKCKGNYHSLYNDTNFLNTNIVTDIPDLFSSFFIDLRDIKTNTDVKMDTLEIVKLFEKHLKGLPGSAEELKHNIRPSTQTQYEKGI
jgi:putative protease